MKKSSLLFLLFTVLFSAQNQRFTYEYKFVKDSTEKSKVTTEIMDLDITAKGSKFYSANKKIADSILEGMDRTNTENIDYSSIKWGKVNEIVEKTYPKLDVYFFQNLDHDIYKVEDTRKIIWKILPDKEQIGNWETQKATTKLYGRTWTAWFSTSLPFQDGPYKFSGLPGLIVKISDATQSHIFELKEVKNLSKDYDWKSVSEKHNYTQPIALNQDRFKKIHQKFRKDPVAGTRQMMSGNDGSHRWFDDKGNELDPKQEIIKQEKRMKESFIKNNNLLELDLLN